MTLFLKHDVLQMIFKTRYSVGKNVGLGIYTSGMTCMLSFHIRLEPNLNEGLQIHI